MVDLVVRPLAHECLEETRSFDHFESTLLNLAIAGIHDDVSVTLDASYVVNETLLRTKCGWSPFTGMRVRGRVRRVTLYGGLAYADNA